MNEQKKESKSASEVEQVRRSSSKLEPNLSAHAQTYITRILFIHCYTVKNERRLHDRTTKSNVGSRKLSKTILIQEENAKEEKEEIIESAQHRYKNVRVGLFCLPFPLSTKQNEVD